MKALGVFVLVLLTDFWWAKYIRATTDRRAITSALYAAGLILLSSGVVLAYVEDPVMILPAVGGAFVGTYLSVKNGE